MADGHSSKERKRRKDSVRSHSKKPKLESEDFDSDDEEYEEMHQPSVLEQIKHILDHEYKDGPQIIRELVQNAEDAGASKMEILFDPSRETPPISEEFSKYFRGPMLCVYNDAVFSKSDWKGIKSIATSVKKQDVRKLGRFGLGFKSVFHMTDSPIILSVDKLLIIDPFQPPGRMCRTIKFKKLTTDKGYKKAWKGLCHILRLEEGGTFNLTKEDILRKDYQHSLFLFPLRQKENKKLSSRIYGKRDVEKLFTSFMEDSSSVLLFLNSLTTINFFQLAGQTSGKKLGNLVYSLQLKSANQNAHKKRTEFKSWISGCYTAKGVQLRDDSEFTNFSLSIFENKKGQQTETQMDVFSCLIGKKDLSNEMERLIVEEQIDCLPVVGMAFPCKRDANFRPHVFCFLPLPYGSPESLTGLPMHINGYFAISQDRRHIELSSSAVSNIEVDWNLCLVRHALPVAFAKFMEMGIQKHSTLYDKIPDPSLVKGSWSILLKPLFESLLTLPIFTTPLKQYVNLSTAVFAIYEDVNDQSVLESVEETLTELEPNFVILPHHIKEVLVNSEYVSQKFQTASAEYVIQLLKNKSGYKQLSTAVKHNLLRYVLISEKYRDLEGIELIPVDNVETFRVFCQTGIKSLESGTVYLCKGNEADLFPGLENNLVTLSKLPRTLQSEMQKMAKSGIMNVQLLQDNEIPSLLQHTIHASFKTTGNGEVVPKLEMNIESWLDKVWNQICHRFPKSLNLFGDIRLVWNSGTLLPLSIVFVLKRYQELKVLPDAVEEVLSFFNISILPSLPGYLKYKYVKKFISLPTKEGVVQALEHKLTSVSISSERILSFNTTVPGNVKDKFVKFFARPHGNEIPPSVAKFLEKLRIFKVCSAGRASERVALCDLKEQDVMPTLKINIYPPKQVINHEYAELALQLGSKLLTEGDVYKQILHCMIHRANECLYAEEKQEEFMKFLLSSVAKDMPSSAEKNEIFLLVGRVKFLKCGEGKHAIKELFQKNKELEELFLHEFNKFPQQMEGFSQELVSGMQLAGLKTEKSLTTTDLEQCATHLSKMNNSPEKRTKSHAVSKYMGEILNSSLAQDKVTKVKETLSCISWLPARDKRLHDYPKRLPWRGKQYECCAPENCFHVDHIWLVGSVSWIYEESFVPNRVEEVFGLHRIPSAALVRQQFKLVKEKCSKMSEARLELIMENIYEFFKQELEEDRHPKDLLADIPFVLIRGHFLEPNQVYTEDISTGFEISLEPFLFKLPEKWREFKTLFLTLGVKQRLDTKDLHAVLKKIEGKHNESSSSNVSRDFSIVLEILKILSDGNGSRTSESVDELLVPVETDNENHLRLLPVSQCTYRDHSIFSSDEDMEELNFIHEKVDIGLASKLGVQSETQRIFEGNDDFMSDWGQKEDFIDRLNSLLKQYQDGFAIPKEMLQNAEDAGAKVLKLIYDERDFREHNRLLLDKGMQKCQGPALWIYNDAVFDEKDFENIKKTNAGTKADGSVKIGKFGLGFCSVYNLTDVPSIVSGDSVLILDPLTEHLGKALGRKENTGIRLKDIWMRKKILAKLRDQFLPFNGVCCCDLSPKTKQRDYRGSLFRFPLRESVSRICSNKYGKQEMLSLLKVLMERAGNLLIFVQNVKTIELHHIKRNGDPTKPTLLYSASKKPSSNRNTNLRELASRNFHSGQKMAFLEEFSVSITVKSDAIKALDKSKAINKHTRSSKTDWKLYWVVEKDQAVHCPNRNVVPLASTAASASFQIGSKRVPYGFYPSGNIYCSLPLPIEAVFPVYINGNFSVDDSRKSLVSRSCDTIRDNESDYNDFLLCSSVCTSYIKLLENMPIGVENAKDYSYLWPKFVDSSELVKSLHRSFYRSILYNKPTVFIRDGRRFPFMECKFLDMTLRHTPSVGQTAFEFLEYKFKQQENVILDMPEKTYDEFVNAGQDKILLKRFITKQAFFSDYFLPDIQSKFWENKNEQRNDLILWALHDKDLRHILRSYSCIPVFKSNIFRKPSELVDPKGDIFHMFCVKDERFPMFSEKKDIEYLLELGMMSVFLPDELLIQQTELVRQISNRGEAAMNRVDCLLSYLEKNKEQAIRLKDRLRHIEFLPTMQKPTDWSPLPWYTKDGFVSPCDTVFRRDRFLVGSVCSVLTDDKMMKVHRNVLELLEVAKGEQIDSHLLIKQLRVVAKYSQSHSKVHKLGNIKKVLEKLFSILEKKLSNEEDLASRIRDFREEKIIIAGDSIMRPLDCCLNRILDMTPFLFSLETRVQSDYQNVLLALEIKRDFSLNEYMNVIRYLNENYLNKRLSDRNFELLNNLLTEISKLECDLNHEQISQMCVPDEHKVLRKPDDVCLNDNYGQCDLESFKFVHNSVNMAVNRMLKIHFKSAKMLSGYNDFAYAFGQKEELVTRLRGILEDYPKDNSILKELIQNADDAQATEIHFIYDMRQHTRKNVLGKEMKAMQGPAFCVFNNKCFTEKDIKGIVSLGVGGKALDPTVTGRFGIGFNAVYHLTDLPSLLTVGRDTPSGKGHLLILDPQCRYAPLAKPHNPGMILNDLERLKKQFPGEYGKYLQDIFPAEEGTWFRLPLRTPAMKSDICSTTFVAEDVDEMLNTLQTEMRKILLFLKHIRRISISKVLRTGHVQKVYKIWAVVKETFQPLLQTYYQEVREKSVQLQRGELHLLDAKAFSTSHDINIRDVSTDVNDHYHVVQNFGFPNDFEVPELLNEKVERKLLGLAPVGAVAFNITNADTSNNVAYCFLPLGIPTNLPVHVNGHFALDKSRTFLYNDESQMTGLWNKVLIESVISHAYVTLLENLKKRFPKEISILQYHRAFPNYLPDSRILWNMLSKSVLRFILLREIPLIPIENNREIISWTALQCKQSHFPAFFDPEIIKGSDGEVEMRTDTEAKMEFDQRSLRKTEKHSTLCRTKHGYYTKYREHHVNTILKSLGMKLVDPPFNSILDNLKAARLIFEENPGPRYLRTEDIISFLKSWKEDFEDRCQIGKLHVPLSSSKLQNMKNVKNLVRVCSSYENFAKELQNLPLSVLENEEICVFTTEKPIFVSRYSEILQKCESQFAHRKMVPLLEEHIENTNGEIKSLTISEFAKFLKTALPNFCPQPSVTLPIDLKEDTSAAHWLHRFWGFLENQRNKFGDYDVEKACLLEFSDLSLVPADTQRGTCLYPFKDAIALIDVNSFTPIKTAVTFKKMTLPSVWNKLRKNKLLVEAIVSVASRPNKVLDCLVQNANLLHSKLEKSDCVYVFRYILDNMEDLKLNNSDSDLKKKLRKIPFYQHFDGLFRALPSKEALVLDIDRYRIPLQGLNKLSEDNQITILKPIDSIMNELYSFLSLRTYNPLEFYKKFLLSDLHSQILSDEELLLHLDWIRQADFTKEPYNIETELKMLSFVPIEDADGRCRQRAHEFYSPHNTLCKRMCKFEELPPKPFSETSWKEFMEVAGMRTAVPTRKFLEFARDIEAKGCGYDVYRLPKELELSSKELIKHLFANQTYLSDAEFLEELSSIRCIVRHAVDEPLALVHPPFETTSALASFRRSALEKDKYICWSACFILPMYADPAKSCQFECTIPELKIEDPVSVHKVLDHLTKMVTVLEPKFLENYGKDITGIPSEKMIRDVMEAIYTRLQDESMDSIKENTITIQSPFIYQPQWRVFLPPSRVVKDLVKPLPPYLSKIPMYFGKFEQLFIRIGCETVQGKHYAAVLSCIYKELNKSCVNEILETEILTVKTAMQGILTSLDTEGDNSWDEIDELYLPTKKTTKGKRHLVVSVADNFVSVDRGDLKERLQKEDIYFCSAYDEQTDDSKLAFLLDKLPEKIRPKPLSHFVHEKLYSNSNELVSNEKGLALTRLLQSFEFSDGVAKILKFQCRTSNKTDNLDFETVSTKIREISILVMPVVQTILSFRGEERQSSVRHVASFFDNSIANPTDFYVSDSSASSWTLWIKRVSSNLVSLIERQLNARFSSDSQKRIEDLLIFEIPSDITSYLEHCGLNGVDANPKQDTSSLEEIGSYVPVELHPLLDNSFVEFADGEVAVYEVYDPLLDEDFKEDCNCDENGSVFIYVRIMRKDEASPCDPHQQKYLIDNGEERIKVSVAWLYKLNRRRAMATPGETPENQSMEIVLSDSVDSTPYTTAPPDLEAILADLRQILTDAWQKDERTRKQIIKRLHLKWHPDKNKENVDLCTKVYQMFQYYITKLEKGESLDDQSSSSRRSGSSFNESSFSSFFENLRRRRRFYEDTGSRYRSSSPEPESRYRPNPQPAVYARWKRQASYDIKTARTMLRTNEYNSYCWICYILHQACEKALKALLYKHDANKVARTHSLYLLSLSLRDQGFDCVEEVRKLESVIGNDMKPRYPDQFGGNKVPAEEFTQEMAREAYTHAERVFQILRVNYSGDISG